MVQRATYGSPNFKHFFANLISEFLQLGQELFPNLSPNGEIKNKSGEVVGTFQLFTPVKSVLAAAYLYFFDTTLIQPSLVSPVSASMVVNKPLQLVRQSSVANPLMTAQNTPVPPSTMLIPATTMVQVQGKANVVPLSAETERLKQQAAASRKQTEELAKLQEKLLQEKSKVEADKAEAEKNRLKLEAERTRVKLEAEKAKAVLEEGRLKAEKAKADLEKDALLKAQKEKREAERLAELEAAMKETMEAAAQFELQKIRDSEVLKREEEELRQQEEIKSKQKIDAEKAQLMVNGSAEEILSQIQKQLEEERVLGQGISSSQRFCLI